MSRLSRIADALELPVTQILDVVVEAGSGRTPPGPRTAPPAPGPRTSTPAVIDWREYGPLDFDPVLRAALEEFLEMGYHGATARNRVALRAVGVGDLPLLPEQAADAGHDPRPHDDRPAHPGRGGPAQGRDAVERFGLLVENLALYHTHRNELGFVGATETRSLQAENRQKIADLRTAQQRMVDAEVDDAVRQGRFRSDYPHEAVRAVVTMCAALPTWWRRGGLLSPEQMAEQYVGFALELMAARPPS